MAQVKGSKKNRRLKAIILDLLSEGDTMMTTEIYTAIKNNYVCENLPCVSTIGTICQAMIQVESLGRVKPPNPTHIEMFGYKPVQTWSLRSIEVNQ
ncbi:unnamed protein product [marine sediment metagenome]|uniref:Uncharacterized protein n=1 Tax=marine sediment metagenome TaxID=412755 RepID=X0ZZI2_9ZZZZ